MRQAALSDAFSFRWSRLRTYGFPTAATCATLVVIAACSGGRKSAPSHGNASGASVRMSIAPAGGTVDDAPSRGITVSAVGGRITNVTVRTRGGPVTGTLNAAGTVWHSTWVLDVAQHYTVTASAVGPSGKSVTRTTSFRTFTPAQTFSAEILEGYHQAYGVGMPIVLFFNRPIVDKAALERALEVKTSRAVVGAWYWDSQCRLAPTCLYFRPRRYWPTNTQVSFLGRLNGVEAAPGVYGDHNLTQTFRIGSSVGVDVNTAQHYMNVYRGGKLFAHWPISSGRPGDDTPDGTYVTLDKENPVDMVGPGYNLEVPWSVRFTWSGDYLHDAYWSVGEQGSTNVSHGCVNMSPTDAEIFYKMAVPGDPVRVTNSPVPGTWDNGLTVWFYSWKQWLRGSALHEAVQAGTDGSTLISPSSPAASGTPLPLGGLSSRRLPTF